MINMETDAPNAAGLTNEKMRELTALCDDLKDRRSCIDAFEDKLKQMKEAERGLSEDKIPALMTEIGLVKITLKSGGELSIKDDLKISIGRRMSAVLDFVRAKGDVGIIKNEVAILFGKGDEEKADQCFKKLGEDFENVRRSSTVNSGTFKAMVKELIEQGVEVPFKELGIFDYRTTIIK